ncbi:YHYH protein [Armatimonas sp.]|uniref:YHYH protein n=1 Tax=Armatimonas sp. TaxID=1872638 RepID=UPI00286AD37C|nr:YHYH protein [Armatimonas sp.]
MKRNTLFLITGLATTLTATIALRAQSQTAGGFKNEVKIEIRDGFRYITANGIPDHVTGQFPNRGNPNAISPQRYTLKVPVKPTASDENISTNGQDFGIAVNGVPFDPSTAEFWNGNRTWRYEAMTGVMGAQGGLGVDENLAHVQPTGAYHYHGMPMGLLKKLDWQRKMALVGWAADGYPIYGNYGYSSATSAKSPLKKLKPSYRLKSGARESGDAPGGAYDGSFENDFEFVKGSGDLDPWNGRYGITPEFPEGTYYYVLTDSFPFIPRKFRGQPDASFQRRGPGGPPGGIGGLDGTSMAGRGQFLFIQRGNTLYQYSADGLKLLGKTELPPP